MKKSKCLRKLAMLPMLFAALTANAQDAIGVSDQSMSRCKDHGYYAPTRSAAPEEGEWFDYSVEKREDGLYLHVVHENVYLNCATSGVEITAQIEGSVITITEREIFIDGQAYTTCICPYDVTFNVGPLQEGDYTLIVTNDGYKISELTVHVSEPLHHRFNVDSYVTKIEKVTLRNVKETDVIYDLQGRRYATFPFPGVFIQNGKKIVWTGK